MSTSIDSHAAPPVEAPRETMGIVHLIALTVGVAVVMRYGGDWSWLRGFRVDDPQSWYFAMFAVVGVCGVGSLLLAAWRRYERASSFPSQAGHWLLLWNGVHWICWQVYLTIHMQVMFGLDPRRQELATHPEQHLPYVAVVAVLSPLALVAWSLKLFWSDRYYRRYAVLAICFHSLVSISQLTEQTSDYRIFGMLAVLGLINLAALLIVIIRNWCDCRRYDFLHWLGLLVQLVDDGVVVFLFAMWSYVIFVNSVIN